MARRGSLKRRLRSLGEREAEHRRDLGVLVLEMYRRDELDTEALGKRAAEIATVDEEIESLRGELGETADEPDATQPPEPAEAPAAATLPATQTSIAAAGAEPSSEEQVHSQLGH